MPLKEFDCDSCGAEFEDLIGMTADSKEPDKCPECGSKRILPRVSGCRVVTRLDDFDDPKDRQVAQTIQKETEEMLEAGQLNDYKVGKVAPSKYRPRIKKRLH